jgi:putative flippase GtrA
MQPVPKSQERQTISFTRFNIRKRIINFIDLFYPLFKKFLPLQTFRYGVCGGSNMLLDITLFFISYNFILHKHVLNLGFIAFEPYTAALWMAFCISFPTGFLLSKYIVFNTSQLRSRVQLFRYIVIVAVNLTLNYVILKTLVEKVHLYPTVARVITTCIVVSFSYLSQKHYTFKTAGKELPAEEVFL